MQGPLGISQSLAQLDKGGRIAVVAVHILEQGGQLRESSLIQAAVLGDTLTGARLKLVQIPTGFGYTDDGNRQVVPFYEGL